MMGKKGFFPSICLQKLYKTKRIIFYDNNVKVLLGLVLKIRLKNKGVISVWI